MNKGNKKSTTLNAIIRVNILDAYDENKFWIVNNQKMLYKDGKQKNGKLPDNEIVQGINDGTIKTDWAIKQKKILVNESEFFRIVKCLDPDNYILEENDYPFLKDIIEIKIGNSHKRYDPWFAVKDTNDCGIIYVNGKRYKKIFCSSSHNRAKKVLCIAEELYDKVIEINLCGIPKHDSNKVNFPCKWSAYEGMSCTDSQPVTMPTIVVIPDFYNPITEMFDVVTGKVVNNQYEISTDIKTEKRQIKINAFDGAGLVDITLANKWAKELGLDYIPSAFQFRAIPGVKGNVYPFDIKKFADTYHVRKIEDRWNKEWDLYDDKIDCIMTESQIKFAKLYDSFKEWKDAFDTDLYGYHRTFNISDYSSPYSKLQRHCIMAYQPLQSLDLSDSEIKLLCEDTVDKVKKIHTDIDSFVKWRGLDEESEKEQGNTSYTNPALRALQYNHSLATDPYVHTLMLDELRNFRRLNHIKIRVDGNFQVLIPDIFGLAQWAFGIQPTGLLDAKQIYNKFWSDRREKELDLIRFPHIAREHCLASVADKSSEKWADMQQWYKYQDVGYVTSMQDSFALRLGGADFDNDHIYGVANKTLVKAIRRQEANTIYFDRDPDEAENNSKVTADDYCAMAKSDSIGFLNDIGTVVNNTSKLWSMITPDNSNNEKIMKYIKAMSTIDSLTIDFVKTGIKADMPKEIKDVLNDYKNPYFFQFRSTKEYNAKTNIDKKVEAKNSISGTNDKAEIYSDTTSTMNRIAHYMDSQIVPLKPKYNVPKFNWEILLQGDYDRQNSTTYNNVKRKLLQLNDNYTSFRGNEFGNYDCNVDFDKKDNQHVNYSHMKLFFQDCRNQLLMLQPNVNRLINDLIVCYYADSSFSTIYNRSILWSCFPSQMIARSKGVNTKGKIYNLEKLQKQHDKIKKKQNDIKRSYDKKKNIPIIDKLDAKVKITNADKKYVNQRLSKTQRSKRLYYILLYIWLKLNSNGNAEKWIKIGTNPRQGQISKFQIQQLSGIFENAFNDALVSCVKHEMIELNFDNIKEPKIKVLYKRLEGKEIELPETCKKMSKWLDRYVPTRHSEKMEFVESETRYYTKKKREDRPTNISVVRVEDGKIYPSISIAAEQNQKASASNIASCCKNKKYCKTAGGYHWMYLSEYNQKQST